jgi:glycosyltransferase involved in cell wall biosynthesis
MSSLSVVIPTYNRKDILQKTLEGLTAQSAWADIDEILVIDDGSTDGTNRLVADYTRCSRVPVRGFRQSNLGQAAARNVGISEVQSSILLFLDDDIVPSPALVTEHLAWHDRHPEPHMGVLGFVTWAPEVRATPFMEWLGLDGPLWAYAHFKPGSRLDFHAFYTCNLSLKTDFLRQHGRFDEDFKGYGWEDTDLGHRLEKHGFALFYHPEAVGYHHKRVTFEEACRRARQVEASSRIFAAKEAGQYLTELENLSEISIKSRVKTLLNGALGPVFALSKPLMDSHVRLPWFLYRGCYNYWTSPERQQAGQ